MGFFRGGRTQKLDGVGCFRPEADGRVRQGNHGDSARGFTHIQSKVLAIPIRHDDFGCGA